MRQNMQFIFHDECYFAEGEFPKAAHFFVVDPKTGALVRGYVSDKAGLVNYVTAERIDVTEVRSYVELKPNIGY